MKKSKLRSGIGFVFSCILSGVFFTLLFLIVFGSPKTAIESDAALKRKTPQNDYILVIEKTNMRFWVVSFDYFASEVDCVYFKPYGEEYNQLLESYRKNGLLGVESTVEKSISDIKSIEFSEDEFKSVIDRFYGTSVTLERDIKSGNDTVFFKGRQTLSGEKAMELMSLCDDEKVGREIMLGVLKNVLSVVKKTDGRTVFNFLANSFSNTLSLSDFIEKEEFFETLTVVKN